MAASCVARPTLNPALRGFWTKPARGRVLYGGRISSKSWDAAGFAIFLASTYSVRFLCTRQFQNKIAESVYTLLKIQIERFGLAKEFDITDRSIVHLRPAATSSFYGLARNISEIRSLEDVDVWWIEEAHFLTKEQWDTVEPTIRKEGSQIWAIFNPQYSPPTLLTNGLWSTRRPTTSSARSITTKIHSSPHTSLEMIARCRAESEDDYQHIYMGNPKQDAEGAVIKRSWIEAAIDAHLKLGFEASGRKVLGFDVADDGEDACANVYAHGAWRFGLRNGEAREDELLKSCSRTFLAALNGRQISATTALEWEQAREQSLMNSIRYGTSICGLLTRNSMPGQRSNAQKSIMQRTSRTRLRIRISLRT